MQKLVRITILLFISLVLFQVASTPARATSSTSPTPIIERPTQPINPDWVVRLHAATGKLRFLAAPSGQSMPQPGELAPTASAQAAARNFLGAYGGHFGLRDEAQELALMKEGSYEGGDAFVRFQQVTQGIPVMAGELIVHLDGARNVRAVNGELAPDLNLDLQPRVSAADAQLTARALAAEEHDLNFQTLEASPPELWVYNPELLGAPGKPGNNLVWRMEVTAQDLQPVRELVLVDAQSGIALLHFNQIDTALYRMIYDNNNDDTLGLPGDGPFRIEGQANTGITDRDNAYDYSGYAYNFYSTVHGRDSIDGKGMKLVSTVLYCPNSSDCPYENAFWNGKQMVYGQSYTSADDVVAHELTHGVTEHESHLYYYMQSGAINEAFSDIWGEFIDQAYNNGNDTDNLSVVWKFGEDLPDGVSRSLSDPTAYGYPPTQPSLPDRMTSSNYYCGTWDNGGVHGNSGVGAKAAYLMVAGTSGTPFNGYNFSGIYSNNKVARIFYEAQTAWLTSGSDYKDLAIALQYGCDNLQARGVVTSSNCETVRQAVLATEMDQEPTTCATNQAPVCTVSYMNEQFNSTPPGWNPVFGPWDITGGAYHTGGGSDGAYYSSVKNGVYGDIDFTASIYRQSYDPSTYSESGLVIRGTPTPLGSWKRWYSGYAFTYDMNGRIRVQKWLDGTRTYLLDWVDEPAVNKGEAWNTVRVIAQGPNLSLFINNRLVWTGTDASLTHGQIGLLMDAYWEPYNEMWVDWATLKGGTPFYLFYEDFENPLAGNWLTGSALGDMHWYNPQTNNPYGADYTFGTSGNYNLWGWDTSVNSDFSVRTVPEIALPAGKNAYLHFSHAYDFENQDDGGVVMYNRNNSGWTFFSDASFLAGGYNTTLLSTGDNPLKGLKAFSGNSNGMVSSLVNLSSLAGGNLQIRFRIGTNTGNGGVSYRGWFLDNVKLYTCEYDTTEIYLPLVVTPREGSDLPYHESFSGSAPGWQSYAGSWSVNPLYYTTSGIVGSFASVGYQYEYSDLTVETRMHKIGNEGRAMMIVVRGDPLPLSSSNFWRSGYIFRVTPDGRFAVHKQVNGGGLIELQPFTASSAIRTGTGWNVFKVMVMGSSTPWLKLFANGTQIYSGFDLNSPYLTSGQVGFGMNTLDDWERMEVDWITIYPYAIP